MLASNENDRVIFKAQRMLRGGASEELNALLDQVTDPESRDSLIGEALHYNNFSAVLRLISESTANDQLSKIFKRATDCKACNVISELCKRGFFKDGVLQYQGDLKVLAYGKQDALTEAEDELTRAKLECEIALTKEQIIPDSGLILMFLQNAFEVAKEPDVTKYSEMAASILEKKMDDKLSASMDALDKYYRESNVLIPNHIVKDEFFSEYALSKSHCVLS